MLGTGIKELQRGSYESWFPEDSLTGSRGQSQGPVLPMILLICSDTSHLVIHSLSGSSVPGSVLGTGDETVTRTVPTLQV